MNGYCVIKRDDLPESVKYQIVYLPGGYNTLTEDIVENCKLWEIYSGPFDSLKEAEKSIPIDE